ncbi:unnamed protein product [Parnassius apollo]|uniref:(apollo) hypothetical protein n=1 Tax=Parnassius apollo TaxID=110799 RepID=A0A8S3X4U0_PARAO|nr:unnamed protein product [Parnassius apollo]
MQRGGACAWLGAPCSRRNGAVCACRVHTVLLQAPPQPPLAHSQGGLRVAGAPCSRRNGAVCACRVHTVLLQVSVRLQVTRVQHVRDAAGRCVRVAWRAVLAQERRRVSLPRAHRAAASQCAQPPRI